MPGDFARPVGGRKKLKRKAPAAPPPKSETAAASGYKTKPVPKGATGVKGSTTAPGRKLVISSRKPPPIARAPFPIPDPLGPHSPIKYLAKSKDYQRAMAGLLRPVDTGPSKSIAYVATHLPKGILAAGDAASEGIHRLQRATDISGGMQTLGPNIGERVTANLPKDAANIVVNTIPATVHLASTAVHDPGKALHQLIQPYKDLVEHPGKMLTEQPLTSALLVTGPLRGASRGVGAVARRGVLGKAAAKAADTTRAPAVAEGARMVHPREYSPDPVGKAIQVYRERRKLKKIAKANKHADQLDAQGRHEQAAQVRHEAQMQHPHRMSEDQVKRFVDEHRETNEQVRRRHTRQVDTEVRAAVRNQPVKLTRAGRKQARKLKVNPTAAVSLTAQNITRPTVTDLQAYLGELKHAYEHGDLTPRQKAQNRQLRGQIQEAIQNPQDPALVERAARAYQGVERSRTEKLVKYRIVDPEQVAKRRELPFAVRSMGAVRDTKLRLTEAGQARKAIETQRADQAQVVRAAEKSVQRTRVKLEQAVADARANAAADGGKVSEARPLPKLSIAGRKAHPSGRDVVEWMNRVERGDPKVLRRARGKRALPSPADTLRRAIAAHDDAQTVLARERAREDELRRQHNQVRKATKGKQLRQAPGFVDQQGRPLSTEDIRNARSVTGHGEPAYVSHAPNLQSPGSFFRESSRPVAANSRAFTGGSVTKGTFDASEEALHANVRKLQSLVDAHEGFTSFIDEAGLRDQQGRLITGDRNRVQAAIDRATLDQRGNPKPGARGYRIVRVHPFGAQKSQLEALVEQVNRHGELHGDAHGEHNPVVSAFEDALQGRGDGPFAAIDETAVARQEQHLRLLGSSGGHAWQVINTLWRKNVLAFSPKWATSNVVEASVRSLVAGVRPRDRALLKRAVDTWMREDPDAATRFLASMGRGHYGMVGRSTRHATAEEFTDPTRHGAFVRTAARLAGTIGRTPVVNWVPKLWGAWTSNVMEGMAAVEGEFRFAMAGTKLRRLHQNSRAFADLSEKGVREALDGLKGTPTQIQVARFVRSAYGKYEAHSPLMRKWIEMYTPFVAWMKNAAHFVGVVLPRDHPVLTAFMADLTSSQEQWLRDIGLWIGEHNSLPSYMLGDIPTPGGGLLNVAKYTPASLLQDPEQTIGSAILPSMSGIVLATKGLDPFGQPLKGSRETGVLKAMLGLVVPSPLVSSGSSGITGRLNPAQVIPKGRVDYARTKAELDRIQQQIEQMPPAGKTEPYSPEYRALLDRRSDLTAQRDRLLVEAGLKTDRALVIREPLRLIRRQIRDAPKTPDQYGYEPKTLAGLRDAVTQLEAVAQALEPPKPKTVKLKKRPLTTGEKQQQAYRRYLKRNPEKAMQDAYDRWLEQQKVDAGR